MKRAIALALLAALAACGRVDDGGNEAIPANGAILPGDEGGVGVGAGADVGAPKQVPLDQLAGVKIGMTVADLRAQGFEAEKDPGPDPDNRCGYARIDGLQDLFFMLDGDAVVRIDVVKPGVPTLGGVTVGMSEAEALERLGEQAVVDVHPYTGPQGHYLVVHEAGAPLGLIVETDGKTVESYRIGRWQQVQWIEGCL